MWVVRPRLGVAYISIDKKTALGRLPPVSGCLYGISLPGLGLTRILPFNVRGMPLPGAVAYGEVRPEPVIPDFSVKVSDAVELAVARVTP